ncbi:hypothetical protein Cgig2_013696 [Carnegiea gigantea]|uniref:Uncharacterized protein n=1 Tax=Carnegiea gigantea TaxID=171969 RepID=A0A9Q1KBY5_9CARY|nr:hypothetical protein Cgig2_013696 [Carnegiea gigantea]
MPQGISTDLLIALLLGLNHLFSPPPPLAGTASLSSRPLGRPDQPSTFPSTAGTGSLTPLAFGTPLRLSRPEQTAPPLSNPPWESEVPEVAKSQDLTKSWISENMAAGFAFMKLMEGCWTPAAPTILEGVAGSWRQGVPSPVGRLPNYRGADRSALTSPAWVGADAAVSSGQPSVRRRL